MNIAFTCGVRFLSRSQVDPHVAAAEPWMPHEVDRPPPPAAMAAAPLVPPPDTAALLQPLLLLPTPTPLLTVPLLVPPTPAFPGAFLFESPGGGPRDLPIGAPHSSLVTTVGGGASPHVPFEPPSLPSGLHNKQ
jgi:hypothetical protein